MKSSQVLLIRVIAEAWSQEQDRRTLRIQFILHLKFKWHLMKVLIMKRNIQWIFAVAYDKLMKST